MTISGQSKKRAASPASCSTFQPLPLFINIPRLSSLSFSFFLSLSSRCFFSFLCCTTTDDGQDRLTRQFTLHSETRRRAIDARAASCLFTVILSCITALMMIMIAALVATRPSTLFCFRFSFNFSFFFHMSWKKIAMPLAIFPPLCSYVYYPQHIYSYCYFIAAGRSRNSVW